MLITFCRFTVYEMAINLWQLKWHPTRHIPNPVHFQLRFSFWFLFAAILFAPINFTSERTRLPLEKQLAPHSHFVTNAHWISRPIPASPFFLLLLRVRVTRDVHTGFVVIQTTRTRLSESVLNARSNYCIATIYHSHSVCVSALLASNKYYYEPIRITQ